MGSAEVPFKVEHVMTGVPQMKCLMCITEAQFAIKEDNPVRPIENAVTLAPSWQSKTVMGQMVMACVAVPACMRHLQFEEKSPQQRAMEGGILLGGNGDGPG